MAITKTTEMQKIVLDLTSSDTNTSVIVFYKTTIDDPDDDELPIVTLKEAQFRKKTRTEDADGNVTFTDTDLSGEEQIIQDAAALIWGE